MDRCIHQYIDDSFSTTELVADFSYVHKHAISSGCVSCTYERLSLNITSNVHKLADLLATLVSWDLSDVKHHGIDLRQTHTIYTHAIYLTGP